MINNGTLPNFSLGNDEVILYEGEVGFKMDAKKSATKLLLTLTSTRMIFEKVRGILKKEKEINDILYSLFPPRGGLTEMYVADDDREKMNKINDELGELKKKLANYELI